VNAISETNFSFSGQTGFYRGKVRDIYYFEDKLVMVATDRISAFDVILPKPIPDKGQILNTIATTHLLATKSIVPNWFISSPDPNVTIGLRCQPIPVEMVVRGYLVGHAMREYKQGKRTLCGVDLPEGMKENDPFPEPIITPTTKSAVGHDIDISRGEILKNGIVSADDYEEMERKSLLLFHKGKEMASLRGLILADTKYEFGKNNGKIFLIDEIHTPDSSRYFYKDDYAQLQNEKIVLRQLSKEFVREWLIENGFQGKVGQAIPSMTAEIVASISNRYHELFEKMTGKKLNTSNSADISERIKRNIVNSLK